ncbi:tRNA (N(6)-L-threonylcarbamoyladenosine(37)-C(2))-methylthiotransferase MtaB [[Clostridium] polysaccharolyticum]|uniref:Threonylcarbamoyladenosine tRNA methylthiotransferase MtaB n=1 Tax=[Clostridium] polysaccharolyticum TaxID=29364 RepID=A0A1H9ZQ66_9FIRM|nr:tRNA (N(6)-L-threonylcarbamoyladenosine(37)-C(2))-methylthiotransferase MtaB [[Clostridium] polysaccharolyticum]SES83895.1 threonylcarbamoyladenosine tRNA methylthiotransferase MtaB [[Clostridium] polysaccharolyticum]
MNINKGKVAFLTLGCKVNSYETNAMETLFQKNGYELVSFQDEADIYIVNTCTVTNMADRKSRQMLHKAKKRNPNAIVVAAGCYVQAAGESVKEDVAVDLIIGNNKKGNVVEAVEEYMASNGIEVRNHFTPEIHTERGYEKLEIDTSGALTRAIIKIQDGCNQFCSYCIIPFARGRVRSREAEDILLEAGRLAESGCQEVVLTGIHLSSYGIDLEPWCNREGKEKYDFISLEGKPLLYLMSEISKIKGVKRIRLGSLEPRIITGHFVSELAKLDKVCPHFHLSLQSGCDETLQRMNRRYTTKEFEENVGIIRKYYKDPAITTDIIVGFPGETEEEFAMTKEFLERIHFSQMHVFKYSARKGTKAESMPDQVPENIKTLRSEEVIALEKQMRKEYEEKMLESWQTVLFEEETELDGEKYFTGHNERYVKFAIKSNGEDLANQIQIVNPLHVMGEGVLVCKQK